MTCHLDGDGVEFKVSRWLSDIADLTRESGALLDAEAVRIEGHLMIDRIERDCHHYVFATQWRALTPGEVASLKP